MMATTPELDALIAEAHDAYKAVMATHSIADTTSAGLVYGEILNKLVTVSGWDVETAIKATMGEEAA